MRPMLFIFLLALLSLNCQKEIEPTTDTVNGLPTVSTKALSSISNTTASGGGDITADGGSAVTARGVCWSISPGPVATGNHTTDGSGTGSFTSAITGLNASTVYFVRAYATNANGTAYGNEISFTASATSGMLPDLTTTAITAITTTAATSGGDISSDGGSAVTARGICWATTSNPVAGGNHTTDGSGTGIFASAITALNAGTVYYVRAYATNINGTAYGNEINFTSTTAAPVLPAIITMAPTSITSTSSVSGGNITADGGAAVTARGVCWGTASGPVATGNHTTDGTGTGLFTSAITGLTPATVYYVRAYATNSVGTAYGNEISFTTTAASPANDIYVAGYENNGTNNVAKYWKNSVAVSLTNGTNNAEANSIFVNGTDIYVAGWEMQGTKKVAKYWKNSVAVALTSGTFDAIATQVIVVGADVYVSGYEGGTGSSRQAKYWKNGTAVNLAVNASEVSLANGIAVVGADVYVAAEIYNPSPSAVIIKNGVVTDLSGGFPTSSANAVFISGADIYVAGNHTSYVSTYWKNNVVTNLSSTAVNTETAAFSIFVSGTDVYVAGFEKTPLALGNIEVAKFWKNGVAANLTNATFHASADAITVFGTDIYAAGYEENAAGNGVAKYWKNGTAVNLTDGTKDAGAYSIVVK